MADWVFVLLPLLAAPIVLLFRFIGCGELLSVSSPEPEVFEFTLRAEPDKETTIAQGGTTSISVKVGPKGGYNKEVKLTASLTGWSFVFEPDKLNPTSGEMASTLNITTPATATIGSTVGINITGTGPGADPAPPPPGQPPPPKPADIVKTLAYNIKIGAAPPAVPDFKLALAPATQQVTRPNPVTFTVTIQRIGGFSDAVDLTVFVNGAAQPGFAGFNPDPVPGTGTTSTLGGPTSGVPAATYTVRVQGRGVTTGTQRDSNDATLTVV